MAFLVSSLVSMAAVAIGVYFVQRFQDVVGHRVLMPTLLSATRSGIPTLNLGVERYRPEDNSF